jgi:glycosyltransferase involved in cell wall biosynthesis
MRVLLLTPAAPAPTHVNGGATRLHRIYRRLIELGDEVTVVTVFTQEQSASIERLRDEGFTIEAHVRPRNRALELVSALMRRPRLLGGLFSRSAKELVASVFWVDLAPTVRRVIAEDDFDVIAIESSFAAFWRDCLASELPVVLVTHEVESVHLLEKARRERGPRATIRRIDARRVERAERRWTPRFDQVIVMSDVEGRLLESIVGPERMPPVSTVGNGADLDLMAAVDDDPGERLVLFTGTMTYPPNVSGVEWLAREVWPYVLAAEPRARLVIAGSSPGRETRELGQLERVAVEADPADMRVWFSRASVCTLPMLEGGGTRLKLIDAFAARRAVVSTVNGAAGIECVAGHDLLIDDTPQGFAAAVVRLLGDDVLRAEVGAHGRELAQRLYSWDTLGEQMHAALEAAVIAQAADRVACVSNV